MGVLWRDQEDHTEHACLLSDELELLYAVDFGTVDDAPYGVELLADSIWRAPFAAKTSYYRLRATRTLLVNRRIASKAIVQENGRQLYDPSDGLAQGWN